MSDGCGSNRADRFGRANGDGRSRPSIGLRPGRVVAVGALLKRAKDVVEQTWQRRKGMGAIVPRDGPIEVDARSNLAYLRQTSFLAPAATATEYDASASARRPACSSRRPLALAATAPGRSIEFPGTR